jgi:hypothetical protein
MSTAVIAQENERACEVTAVMVMNAVADGLADHGLDVLGPAWEETHCFKITNVLGALCEVVIGENGWVCWEYRQVHGYRADPTQVTAMVLEFLGASGAEHRGTPPGRNTGLTLKGAVGLALRERGMQARLGRVARDESACEVYAEVEVTNPARHDRGRVWVTDEGVVRWECRFSDPARDIQGIDPEEISATIARSFPE